MFSAQSGSAPRDERGAGPTDGGAQGTDAPPVLWKKMLQKSLQIFSWYDLCNVVHPLILAFRVDPEEHHLLGSWVGYFNVLACLRILTTHSHSSSSVLSAYMQALLSLYHTYWVLPRGKRRFRTKPLTAPCVCRGVTVKQLRVPPAAFVRAIHSIPPNVQYPILDIPNNLTNKCISFARITLFN